jgi:predicted glycogen debranching enzyme
VLDFGRDVCGDARLAERREWLVTNGIGGFACGTVGGLLTRRYHGLLMAALKPPVGRTLLLAKLDDTAAYDGHQYPLFANRWAGGVVEPAGFSYLERFRLEGAVPVWSFALGAALLEKRVWMQPGADTTYIRYDLRRAGQPLHLSLKALVNYRDYHATTQGDGWHMQIEPVRHGLRVTAFDGATPFSLLSAGAVAEPAHTWHHRFELSVEAARGLDAQDDHLHAGTFSASLREGESLTLVASTDAAPLLDGAAALAERFEYERRVLDRGPGTGDTGNDGSDTIVHLLLAADQFIVRRPLLGERDGFTVMAGYPWFADWGRDAMIALPGLTLTTGRPEMAAGILRTYARCLDRGMLPNRFPDDGEAPEYNAVDATLWYLEAIRAYHAATGDDGLVRDLFPALREVIAWHQRGTRFGIHVDPDDGLLYAGEPGVQLTWMDARVNGRVVTPRTGKPVEVNALWYNAVRTMAGFARRLGEPDEPYTRLAAQIERGFGRFWHAAGGYCFDVLDGPDGHDPRLRPNQLLAVSLPASPLAAWQQRAVVDSCARYLLTSHGLRTLAPDDPAYAGRYGGGPAERDAAYHQGTVWGWLIGPFVSAHLRVYGDARLTRSFLHPLLQHLTGGCIGSLGEIFDGDPPHQPHGCFAQAWTVAEVLRAWHETAARV